MDFSHINCGVGIQKLFCHIWR